MLKSILYYLSVIGFQDKFLFIILYVRFICTLYNIYIWINNILSLYKSYSISQALNISLFVLNKYI